MEPKYSFDICATRPSVLIVYQIRDWDKYQLCATGPVTLIVDYSVDVEVGIMNFILELYISNFINQIHWDIHRPIFKHCS